MMKPNFPGLFAKMLAQPTLRARAARCIATARSGSPVMLIASGVELEEARRLRDGENVIVCDGEDARRFLAWLGQKRSKK